MMIKDFYRILESISLITFLKFTQAFLDSILSNKKSKKKGDNKEKVISKTE